LFISAVGAGIVNALAGGGTLITFPTLMAVGIPAVAANVTSTVALCPGYLGAAFAQRKELKGEAMKLWLLPAGGAGGILGGILLLNTGERMFSEMVPYLILLASFLLSVQNRVRNRLSRNNTGNKRSNEVILSSVLVLSAAVYGGYFGAGLSVIILSVLGITLDYNLVKLNALKQFIAFSVNVSAAVFFLFSSMVIWIPAIIMAAGALAGGFIGGKLAGFIEPSLLRTIVVTAGIVIAVIYFFR
jgi:uncharacterized membrane protein YfcA